MHNVIAIFTDVILPVLVVVGLGAAMQRFKQFDVKTLADLSLWLLVPTFLFEQILKSDLAWTDIGGVAVAVLVPLAGLGAVLYYVMRKLGVAPATLAVILICGLVYNAGNFGIPVAQLIYQESGIRFPGMTRAEDGVAVQAIVILMSNLSTWCLGYVVMALALGNGVKGALGIFKLPMIYAVVLAFILRDTGTQVPTMLRFPIQLIAQATVPVMLLALGCQLAHRARWPRWRLITPVLGIKLLLLPLVTGLFVWSTGVWPWPGAQLVIAAAAPSAVNTFILAHELEGDAELAADCVFWTTIFSALTATLVMAATVSLGAQ